MGDLVDLTAVRNAETMPGLIDEIKIPRKLGYEIAEALMKIENYELACRVYTCLIKTNAHDVQAIIHRATCHEKLGQQSAYIEDIRRASSIDPNQRNAACLTKLAQPPMNSIKHDGVVRPDLYTQSFIDQGLLHNPLQAAKNGLAHFDKFHHPPAFSPKPYEWNMSGLLPDHAAANHFPSPILMNNENPSNPQPPSNNPPPPICNGWGEFSTPSPVSTASVYSTLAASDEFKSSRGSPATHQPWTNGGPTNGPNAGFYKDWKPLENGNMFNITPNSTVPRNGIGGTNIWGQTAQDGWDSLRTTTNASNENFALKSVGNGQANDAGDLDDFGDQLVAEYSQFSLDDKDSDEMMGGDGGGGRVRKSSYSEVVASSIGSSGNITPVTDNGGPKLNDSCCEENCIGPCGDPMNPQGYLSVWVGGVADSTTKETLLDLFNACGPVKNIKLMPEKHCAFIDFHDTRSPGVAMHKLQGYAVNGSELHLEWPKSVLIQKGKVVRETINGRVVYNSQQPTTTNECIFWRRKGCRFGDQCRYLHILENKGVDTI